MDNPFENNELCDGKHCQMRDRCVRYMGNIDMESDDFNTYVFLNLTQWRGQCPYFMDEDNGCYPQAKQK